MAGARFVQDRCRAGAAGPVPRCSAGKWRNVDSAPPVSHT